MADGGVGAGEDEVVGHVRTCERDVGFGFVGPLFLQIHTIAADDGVGWDLRDVEARRADNDVQVVVFAVFGVDARFVDGYDGGIGEGDVGFGERFEVSVAGGDTPIYINIYFISSFRSRLIRTDIPAPTSESTSRRAQGHNSVSSSSAQPRSSFGLYSFRCP